jgi:hypothetical protein
MSTVISKKTGAKRQLEFGPFLRREAFLKNPSAAAYPLVALP